MPFKDENERREYKKKYYEANKEKILEYKKNWYEKNREGALEYQKKYTEENKNKVNARKKKYYEDNREKVTEYRRKWQEENREAIKGYRKDNSEAYILYNIKRRAKNKGVPFDITVEDILNPGVCPALGINMKRGSHTHSYSSPSVDRIIPELGYVKGNIQVISKKANTMKSDATPEELRMFAKWVLKTFPEELDDQT